MKASVWPETNQLRRSLHTTQTTVVSSNSGSCCALGQGYFVCKYVCRFSALLMWSPLPSLEQLQTSFGFLHYIYRERGTRRPSPRAGSSFRSSRFSKSIGRVSLTKEGKLGVSSVTPLRQHSIRVLSTLLLVIQRLYATDLLLGTVLTNKGEWIYVNGACGSSGSCLCILDALETDKVCSSLDSIDQYL